MAHCFLSFIATGFVCAAALTGALTTGAGPAFACACCAEENTYSVAPKKWSPLIGDAIVRLRHVSGTLREQGPEARSGLKTEGMAFGRTGIAIGVKGGSLTLTHKGRYFERLSDVSVFIPPTGPGATLLKEYIFRGQIRFLGTLAKRYGAKSVMGFIVLKAVGNRCAHASNFKAWSIRFRVGGRAVLGGGRLGSR